MWRLRILGLLMGVCLLTGCGQYSLRGQWQLDGPGRDDTVITFFSDGTYSHDVYAGQLSARGTFKQPDNRLILRQTSWHAQNPEQHQRTLALPLDETEVEIKWLSPTEAELSAQGITKRLRRM